MGFFTNFSKVPNGENHIDKFNNQMDLAENKLEKLYSNMLEYKSTLVVAQKELMELHTTKEKLKEQLADDPNAMTDLVVTNKQIVKKLEQIDNLNICVRDYEDTLAVQGGKLLSELFSGNRERKGATNEIHKSMALEVNKLNAQAWQLIHDMRDTHNAHVIAEHRLVNIAEEYKVKMDNVDTRRYRNYETNTNVDTNIYNACKNSPTHYTNVSNSDKMLHLLEEDNVE